MRASNIISQNLFLKYVLAVVLLMGAMAGVSVSIASPAFADCGAAVCGGTGGGGSSEGGTDTGGGITVPNPPGGGGGTPPGGGGGGGGYWDQVITDWVAGGPPVAFCPTRNDGKNMIGYYVDNGVKMIYQRHQLPVPDASRYIGYFPDYVGVGGASDAGGWHVYRQMKVIGTRCVYPPRTELVDVRCYISSTVKIDRVVPNPREISRTTGRSGYSEGSYNYDACVNSKGRVDVSKGFDSYGYYNLSTSRRMANAVAEVQLEPHPITGAWPGPKIVSLSPAYDTAFAVVDRASLHCSAGFQKPGVMHSDWTDAPCINVSYVCPYVDPKIDVSDTGKAKEMRSFKGKLQLVRDGKNRELQFGLGAIRGSSISVGSHQTRFLRGGTPWDAGKSYNKNLFELSTSPSSTTSLLSASSGGATSLMPNKVNNVFTRGYFASETGKPTTVTQEVTWKGTRQVRSGFVTGVDPVSGAITGYGSHYITVPTSGKCSQTATLEYVRAIGHETGN